MPSKLTATQLKGRVLDQEAAQEGAELGSSREKRQPEGLSRPDFMVRERGLTAAQRGTALHLAMQYLPLEGDHSPETIREELRRLTAEGFLTSQQGEAVPPEVPAAFFASELGRQLLAAREVHREFKFSILMPAADYGPGLEGEEVLLQGVVDCWFDGLEGITVLDFKSDRIRPGGEAARGRSTAPSWRRTAGRWSGSPDGGWPTGSCGSLPQGLAWSCERPLLPKRRIHKLFIITPLKSPVEHDTLRQTQARERRMSFDIPGPAEAGPNNR